MLGSRPITFQPLPLLLQVVPIALQPLALSLQPRVVLTESFRFLAGLLDLTPQSLQFTLRVIARARGRALRHVRLMMTVQPDAQYTRLMDAIVRDVWRSRQTAVAESARDAQRKLETIEGKEQQLLNAFLYEKTLPRHVYEAESERLRLEAQNVPSQVAADDAAGVDVDRALEFSRNVTSNAAEFWRTANDDVRRRFQRVVFPKGVTFGGGVFGTPATSLFFKRLGENSAEESSLASLMPASWNQIVRWLRQIDGLRAA